MNVRPVQKRVESRPLVRKASIREVCPRLLAEQPAPADWPERLREAESAASNSVPEAAAFDFHFHWFHCFLWFLCLAKQDRQRSGVKELGSVRKGGSSTGPDGEEAAKGLSFTAPNIWVNSPGAFPLGVLVRFGDTFGNLRRPLPIKRSLKKFCEVSRLCVIGFARNIISARNIFYLRGLHLWPRGK